MNLPTYSEAVPKQQAGWGYSSTGTPCAIIWSLDDPADEMVIPCDTWWQALRFALSFCETNSCEFVGGPGDE